MADVSHFSLYLALLCIGTYLHSRVIFKYNVLHSQATILHVQDPSVLSEGVKKMKPKCARLVTAITCGESTIVR